MRDICVKPRALNEVVYFPEMPKDPRVDDVLVTLGRIDERIKSYGLIGGIIAVALSGWLAWLTNKVVSGPVSLAAIAVSPVNEKTVKKTREIVIAARQDKDAQRISSDLVRSVGQKMISASGGTNKELAHEAWSTVIELIGYRSLLNVNLSPVPPDIRPRVISDFLFQLTLTKDSDIGAGDDLSKNLRTFGDDVPIEQAARMEGLDSNANAGRPFGPRVLLVEFPKAKIRLDGLWYKNVIFKNTTVAYSGGRTKLENVYFINCGFQIENVSPSRALAEQMIANAAVSFDGTLLSQRIMHDYDANRSAIVHTRSVSPEAIAGVAPFKLMCFVQKL